LACRDNGARWRIRIAALLGHRGDFPRRLSGLRTGLVRRRSRLDRLTEGALGTTGVPLIRRLLGGAIMAESPSDHAGRGGAMILVNALLAAVGSRLAVAR
jgi:hypothetical protein